MTVILNRKQKNLRLMRVTAELIQPCRIRFIDEMDAVLYR